MISFCLQNLYRPLTGIAFAGEASGDVDAGAVAADAVHDGALVDVDAAHVVLVESVTLTK
jgi:hypothetical protein